VTVRFGGVQALDGVDVAVPAGGICALIGPNGAGKTTLFNCLSGIVTPDSGRVYLGRDDVTDMAPHRRAALGLGRTFQSVELFDGLSVLENLMVAAHVLHTSGPVAQALLLPSARRAESAAVERATATLSTLGIEHLADATPGELTSADLRRVEMGCVLVRGPKVLLLDEPTAGLDASESAEIAQLVRRVRDERKLTVLLVEHDMAVVGDIADWVFVLDFGRIIASDAPGAIRRNRLVINRYLGEEPREVQRARSS
jgi:branched-chain amino acid transport system ATP-binding protein